MQRPLKKILKVLFYMVLLFSFMFGLFFLYFLVKKDDIAGDLLLRLNEDINGEVSFTDIYLDPFAQFPAVSFALEDFYFFEKEDSVRDILEDPIAEFEDVFIAFDVFSLLNDKIIVTKLLFADGYLDILKYQNGLYNFEIALAKKKLTIEKKRVKKKKIGTLKKKTKRAKQKRNLISKTLKLNLNKVSFKNVHFEHNNQRDGSQDNFLIQRMIASLSIYPDTIKTNLYLKTEIQRLQAFKNIQFDDLMFELSSKLNYSRNDSILLINPGKLMFSRAEFRINGNVDFKKKWGY